MAYKFVDPTIGKDEVNVTATFATSAGVFPKYGFGQTALATDSALGAGVFVYAAGGANVAAGNAVVFRGVAGSVSQLATASNGLAGRVGVVYAPISASNVAGWVQVYGHASPVTISSAATLGDLCKIGSTAGCIERSPAASVAVANQIYGAFVASVQSASSASGVVFLNYPYVAGV